LICGQFELRTTGLSKGFKPFFSGSAGVQSAGWVVYCNATSRLDASAPRRRKIIEQYLAAGQPTWRNPTEKNGKLVWYSPAVGSGPRMADVILERVWEAVRRFVLVVVLVLVIEN
jgi:hypothetical protein